MVLWYIGIHQAIVSLVTRPPNRAGCSNREIQTFKQDNGEHKMTTIVRKLYDLDKIELICTFGYDKNETGYYDVSVFDLITGKEKDFAE